jgi:hypothetical protein
MKSVEVKCEALNRAKSASSPRLNASEARHRLAPSERQKENKWKTQEISTQKNGGKKMIKISKQKYQLLKVTLTLLLISCAYASLMQSAHATTELTLQQKGLSIMNDVVGLDMKKYTMTTKENQPEPQILYPDVLPQREAEYDIISGENSIKALCTFVDGNLQIIHVLENHGSPTMIKLDASANAVDMAKDFLDNYKSYTADSLYGELESSLETVDVGKNTSKTSGNVLLEVTTLDGCTSFRWTYVFNGAVAPSKIVALSFKNGFLWYFVDKWNFYNVGTTNISLSKGEAVTIALDAAKAYNWSLKLNVDTLDTKNFNESNLRWASLIFDDSLGAGTARCENLLTVYPVWRVGLALDRWYGQLYGIEVDVWADTGEVRRVQEAWSTLPPPEGVPIAGTDSQAPTTKEESNLALMIGLPALAIATLVLGVSIFRASRKKNTHLYSLLKARSMETGGILLCALILSTMFLSVVATVNATTRVGVIWGSESNEAIDPETGKSWRKNATEIDLQQDIADNIDYLFDNNGYTGINKQGNKGSTKNQILSDIGYYQSNYDYTAVVVFDHGVGTTTYFANSGWGYPYTQEFHFMFEDQNGTKWGNESAPVDMPSHGVYDTDIYPLITAGNINLAFINTCMSAKTTAQGSNPGIGQGLLSPDWPPVPERYEGMPFAWTHRLVEDKSSMQNFNVEEHMSDDGYNDPDFGPQVYIGFPYGSASLMQRIPYDGGTYTYHYWVYLFFYHALFFEMSVNQALDAASLYIWSTSFAESPLQGDGFTCYWWKANPETMENCTMAIYGNGNIFLKNYEPDFVSTPSVGGPTSGETYTSYEFAASSMDPYGHSIRYTFDWGDNSPQNVTGWYSSGAVATMSHSWSSEDVFSVTVRAQCDNGAWSSWSSPYNVEIGDLPELTVYAYDQYENPLEAPLYIDDEYVGTTGYSYPVLNGDHWIEVADPFVIDPPYAATFDYYYFDGDYNYDNPADLSLTSDKTVIAYYYGWY